MYVAVCFNGAENGGTEKTLSRRGFTSENGSLNKHSGNRSGSNSSALIRVMIKQWHRHRVWPGLGLGLKVKAKALITRPRTRPIKEP